MSKSRDLAQANERLVFALLDSAMMLERRLDLALSHTRGISFTEYRLLRGLSQLHGGVGMRVELANSVGLTPSAITRALKPLEKLGYVRTQQCERDARRSLVSLTTGGVKLLADAQAAVAEVVSDLPLARLNGMRLSELRHGLLGISIGAVSARERK